MLSCKILPWSWIRWVPRDAKWGRHPLGPVCWQSFLRHWQRGLCPGYSNSARTGNNWGEQFLILNINLLEFVIDSFSCALFYFLMSCQYHMFKVNLHGCDGSSPCVELSATVGTRDSKLKLPLPVGKYANADQVWVSDRHRDKWFAIL